MILAGTPQQLTARFVGLDGDEVNPVVEDEETVFPVTDLALSVVLDSTGAAIEADVEHQADGLCVATIEAADVETLHCTWTGSLDGTQLRVQDEVEVVGNFVTGPGDVRRELTKTNSTVPALPVIRGAIEWAESVLERACNRAFRPRYAKENIAGHTFLSRSDPIRTLTLADQPIEIDIRTGWVHGYGDLAYVYGLRQPPADVRRACTRLAYNALLTDPNNLNERATSFSADGANYSLVTPGRFGIETALPEANAVIARYRLPGVG